MNYVMYIMKKAPWEAAKNPFLLVFSGLGQRDGTIRLKKAFFGAWLAKFSYFNTEIVKLQEGKPSSFSLLLKALILRLKVNLKNFIVSG